jgi:hypothetical protein
MNSIISSSDEGFIPETCYGQEHLLDIPIFGIPLIIGY